MATTNFTSVDEYIRAQPKLAQTVLRRVRRIIRLAVPAADEVISYQMPAYSLDGAPMLGLAAWKQHYSLYPASDDLVAAIPDLAPHRNSTGTLRFSLSEPVPTGLIARFARFRAQAARRRTKARRAAGKRR